MFNKKQRLNLKTGIFLGAVLVQPLVFGFQPLMAEDNNYGPNYKPPQTPALHESSSLDKKNDPNLGKLYLGLTAAGGQTFSAESDDSSGMAYDGGIDIGYIHTENWGRFSFGAELTLGKYNYRDKMDGDNYKIELPVNYAALLKGTYGYALGSNIYGELKAGFGFVNADYEASFGGLKITSEENLTGMAYQVGYDFVFPMDHFELLAGFDLTHVQLDLGKVKITENSVVSYDETLVGGRTLVFNTPKLEVGFRLLL